MSIITPMHTRLYHDEGYMVLPGVISPSVLEMLREECSYYVGYCDSILDAKGVQSDGLTHRSKRYFISNRYRSSSRLWEFIFGPLMAQVVSATLGSEAYLFHEQWVVKGAEQGMKFSWHQDSGYVAATSHEPYLTCWCTLDDVSEENGTVYILPHSRGGTKNEVFEHKKEEGSNELVGYFGTDRGEPVNAPAGSIVAFTSHVFHRSGPNVTDRMRRVYLPQYSSAPIKRADGKPWALATPFLRGGKIIYDRAADTAGSLGPFPREN